MTREEAKELLPIIQAFADSKTFVYGPVMPFDIIYKYYTFIDGTPFGIKEE